MSRPALSAALRTAKVLFERPALEAAIARMADELRAVWDDGEIPVYLTVMNGAMPFASQLAFALGERGMDLEFDYLHATRYRGETQGADLVWKHRPETPLRGRRVLLVDDILDEGHTLLEVQRWCEAQGAAEVRIAVLTRKRHDRCVEGIHADHVGVELPDAFVFGYGMDYYEQGRNLPEVYALGE